MLMPTDEDRWASVEAHTCTEHTSPPIAVLLAVMALVGDAEIKGSWTDYRPSRPEDHTTWTEIIATADRLIYVEMLFNRGSYDRHEDDSGFNRNSLIIKTNQAWSRRLCDIATLHIGSCATRMPQVQRDRLTVGDVRLVFRDGYEVNIGFDQQSLIGHPAVYERSDQLLTAVRGGAGL